MKKEKKFQSNNSILGFNRMFLGIFMVHDKRGEKGCVFCWWPLCFRLGVALSICCLSEILAVYIYGFPDLVVLAHVSLGIWMSQPTMPAIKVFVHLYPCLYLCFNGECFSLLTGLRGEQTFGIVWTIGFTAFRGTSRCLYLCICKLSWGGYQILSFSSSWALL